MLRLFARHLVLVFALVFAQMSGFAHGISHAQTWHGQSTQQDDSGTLTHNCVVFDALTSVYTPPTPFNHSPPAPLLGAIGNVQTSQVIALHRLAVAKLQARGPPVFS